jgi:hypothetical protein
MAPATPPADELWGHVRDVLDDRHFLFDVTAGAVDDAIYEKRETVETDEDVHVGDLVHLWVQRRGPDGSLVGSVAVEFEIDPDAIADPSLDLE